MRRLIHLVRRLPCGDVTRRAIEESLVDGWHSANAVRGPVARAVHWLVTCAAVIRVVATVFDVLDLEHPMRHLMTDSRYAARRLRQSPAFVAFSILTLALGIGATTAIFALMQAALWPDRGFAHIDRLVIINHARGGSGPTTLLSWGDYLDLRARQTTLDRVTGTRAERVAVVVNGASETAAGEFVTGDTFDALGVPMTLGRPIQPADDRQDATPVVVLSHRTWRRLFGGSVDVLGAHARINGVDFEIVGVAGAAVASISNGLSTAVAWMPMSTMARAGTPTSAYGFDVNERTRRWVFVVGRLAPGRTVDDARVEIELVAKQLDLEAPIGRDLPPQRRVPSEVSRPWSVRRTADVVLNASGDELLVPMAMTLMSVVALVLLVACTNLANMTLARATARRHELAVRRALGSSRWRLVREILVESGIVACVGAVAGLGIARVGLWLAGGDLLISNTIALRLAPRIDFAVVAIAALATLVAMLVAGLLPALQATRQDVRSVLAVDSIHGGVARWRGRRLLIAGQVTVSIVLVALAALCVFQVRATRDFDRGIDLDRLAVAAVDFGTQQYGTQRAIEIATTAAQQVALRPDVESVAVSSGWPVFLRNPGAAVRPMTDGGGTPGHPFGVQAQMVAATPSIVRTLGLTLESGRFFDVDDARTTSVIVISGNTAKRIFGAEPAVGQQLRFKRSTWAGESSQSELVKTVIGVVSDVNRAADRESYAVYLPLDQQPERILTITARVSDEPRALLAPMRAAFAAIDPDVAIEQLTTGQSLTAFDVVFLRVLGGLALVLGSIALILALAGLYGVLSHIIGRRTREIGVRIALGADRGRILRMVLRDGLHPVVLGVVVGLVLGAVARMSLSPMFRRFAPVMDPWVLVVVPAAMIAAGALACYLPARRAARIDPTVALRD